jgi:spermidine synthase
MIPHTFQSGDETWFLEAIKPAIGQALRVDEVLYEGEIDHQRLLVFENEHYGRLFALNGIVQLTTADEFAYHEMIAHVPLFAHGAAKRVLIVGGGDGGVLREVLRHDEVERATLVEIEGEVVAFSKRWFPSVSDGAFADPRAEVVIADGAAFVKEDRRFDVIIVDSTDPVGPGEVLFTEGFYRDCRDRLAEGGIMVTQCGVPFLQPGELKRAHDNQAAAFGEARFYGVTVPTYAGGLMTLGYARKGGEEPSPEALGERVARSGLAFRYYGAAAHLAAFALPAYVNQIIETGRR